MRKKTTLIVLAVILVILAGATIISRDALRARAFALTGEESLAGQARGMAQLALNITRPQPVTEPDTLIEHADVIPYGMNTFLHNEVEEWKREEQLRLLSEAGFYWLREQFPWEDIEIHGRGDFTDRRNDPAGVDAWAKYDNIVELVEQYDMQLIVRLGNPPAWSRSQPVEEIGAFAPPDDYDDFAAFAGQVAERYEGRVSTFQIWNEPNIYPEWGEQTVSPEDYTDLLCRTYTAIKEANPDAVVISGALAPTSELSGRDFNDFLFLQRMYDAGAGDCFDVLSVQGYGLWSGPTDHRMRPIVVNYARNQYIRDIMVRNGDEHKAIWISEMNWNTAPEDVAATYGRVTPEQQARFAPLAYQRAEEDWPWIGVVNFWYFKRADWSWLEERRPEAYFQMADPDFNLTPAYEAMQAYTSQTPVMYQGTHAATHWAVAYSEDWVADGNAMRAEAGADSAVFTFTGRRLTIDYEPLAAASIAARCRVDGGEWHDLAADQMSVEVWRGTYSTHTVEIEPVGGIVIEQYRVVGKNNVTVPIVAGVVLLLIAGVAVLLRRSRKGAAHD